jgi:hypothetical protein
MTLSTLNITTFSIAINNKEKFSIMVVVMLSVVTPSFIMLSVMAPLDDLFISCPRKRFIKHCHQITVNASAVVFAQVHPLSNVIKLFSFTFY